MPGMRVRQGREGHHGAAARAQGQEHADRRRRPKSAAPQAPSPVAMLSPQEQEFRTKLKELRDHLTANADNVGKKFPEEARKMHYGEIEHRSIYGEATAAGRQGAARGRDRVSSAAGAAGRAELAAGPHPEGARRSPRVSKDWPQARSVPPSFETPRLALGASVAAPQDEGRSYPAAATFSRACQKRITRCAE